MEETLLKWSVEDVASLSLVELTEIPTKFASIEQYRESFVPPLFDEVRQNVARAMQAAYLVEQGGLSDLIPKEKFKVPVSFGVDTFPDRDDLSFVRTLNPVGLRKYDLLLIHRSDARLSSGRFLFVTDVVDYSTAQKTRYRFKIDGKAPDWSQPMVATVITSLTSFKRIYDALKNVRIPTGPIVQFLLDPTPIPAKEIDEVELFYFKSRMDDLLALDKKLNQSQLEAAFRTRTSGPIQLIQGTLSQIL